MRSASPIFLSLIHIFHRPCSVHERFQRIAVADKVDIVLESDENADHGQVVENKRQDNGGKDKEQQRLSPCLLYTSFLTRRQGSGTKINKDMGEELLSELKKYANENTPKRVEKFRKTVAVILPDLKSRYMNNILDGIQNLVMQSGWDILVAISN